MGGHFAFYLTVIVERDRNHGKREVSDMQQQPHRQALNHRHGGYAAIRLAWVTQSSQNHDPNSDTVMIISRNMNNYFVSHVLYP